MKSKADGKLPNNTVVEYIPFDDNCTQGKASGDIVRANKMMCPNVVIGPSCDYCVGMQTSIIFPLSLACC